MGFSVRHDTTHRNGLIIEIPSKKGLSNLKLNSFCIRGPEVFNSLPKDLRELDTSMDTYKSKQDTFLSMIEDSPRISHGSKSHSNNLDVKISQWKWSLRC